MIQYNTTNLLPMLKYNHHNSTITLQNILLGMAVSKSFLLEIVPSSPDGKLLPAPEDHDVDAPKDHDVNAPKDHDVNAPEDHDVDAPNDGDA